MSGALGRLERVDLRAAWPTESGQFTPWLGTAGNIDLLSEALGMSLELQAREARVGPFRADLLCVDMDRMGVRVLVENQLEATDHGHLGQLLTYAAGLEAVSIVWIASQSQEDHRAALDWLNRVTGDGVDFFGLEIELWRIGTSPPAPKFNVVAKPNGWSDSVRREAEAAELSDASRFYLGYWTAFTEHVRVNRIDVPAKPRNNYGFTIGTGRTGVWVEVEVVRRRRAAWVGVYVSGGQEREERFNWLLANRSELETAMGCPLEWRPSPDRTRSWFGIEFKDMDVDNAASWPTQHENIARAVERLLPAIRRLVAKMA